MKKVLCVCPSGTARSVMMAALLQRELGDEYQVESAGVQRGCESNVAEVFAFQCLLERGIDISGHRTRGVLGSDDSLMLYGAKYVVCASEKIENEIIIYLAGDRVTKCIIANEKDGGIKLPQWASIEEYRECASLIERCVPDIANQIRASR